MALHPISRMVRPKTFLHFISLLTATEFITISLLINKVEGVYGILALFTGYHLSALQLSMYIYSIVIFALVCYLGPHIRRQSPLQNLALAWIYVLDTLINAAYTTLFGLTWFIILAQHFSPSVPAGEDPLGEALPGGKTINDTAGFTDPEAKVDRVEIIATPRPGTAMPGQDAVAHGVAGSGNSFGNVLFQSGSIMSVTIISSLWFVRIYFVVIIMAYARGVLRQAIASTPPHTSLNTPLSAPDPVAPADSPDRNPFHHSLPAGQGWQGRLGRILVSFPSGYWLGKDESDEEWVRGADERFTRYASSRSQPRGPLIKNPPPPTKGTTERERRARSGTGPPPPGLDRDSQARHKKNEGSGSGSDV